MYVASKGRSQTPKSLCLGLRIRQLTGFSQVVSLLSGLGHCASWDTVVSLDTSHAQLQLLEGRDKILVGFSKKTPTILVWENIDFWEETVEPLTIQMALCCKVLSLNLCQEQTTTAEGSGKTKT